MKTCIVYTGNSKNDETSSLLHFYDKLLQADFIIRTILMYNQSSDSLTFKQF
ncbi:hypothetical protein MTR_3g106285 [Medicago truncatula]|uniref:Uncharacterized protein n=1 Tax=Medicago truncatula TaxID=3880 RepID=A0A072V3I7_MEDTR|nr:hypothetical protein MTR_3g106285 [Medicago truncatula]